MNPSRPDVVFDCNVFLQAISRAGGPAAHALRLMEQNAFTLHLSRPIVRELRRTLEYAEIREKNPHVTDALVDEFVTRIRFRSVVHRNVPRVFNYARDPGDEPYLDLVALVGADFLVTRDKDLLCLATDHTIEAKEFRQRMPGTRVIDPVEFAAALSKVSGS